MLRFPYQTAMSERERSQHQSRVAPEPAEQEVTCDRVIYSHGAQRFAADRPTDLTVGATLIADANSLGAMNLR